MMVRLDYIPILQDHLALCFYLCPYILPHKCLFLKKNVVIHLLLQITTLPFPLPVLIYMVLAPCSNHY